MEVQAGVQAESIERIHRRLTIACFDPPDGRAFDPFIRIVAK
jgi:hypothetical protein